MVRYATARVLLCARVVVVRALADLVTAVAAAAVLQPRSFWTATPAAQGASDSLPSWRRVARAMLLSR